MPEERLQKILSQAGIASRRKAEEYIQAGRVTVNGEIVTELGSKADLDRDHIKVDGRLIHRPKTQAYILMNKPREVMTTTADPEGRQTVMHLLKRTKDRVFPVGRLDYHSEGLLLLTNDGELANRLIAPASHIEKTYLVKVNGRLTTEQMETFRGGIALHGRRTRPAAIRLARPGQNPWYEVVLVEGRQQQIRLMFKNLGLLVEKLKRVRLGPLDLGDLPSGEYRHLVPKEVARLKKAVGLE